MISFGLSICVRSFGMTPFGTRLLNAVLGAPLPSPTKIEQIFARYCQALVFQRLQDESAHGHVGVCSQALQLLALALSQSIVPHGVV